MCCSPMYDGPSKVRVCDVCSECASDLDEYGEPIDGCTYSPVACDTCGWQPCDGSC